MLKKLSSFQLRYPSWKFLQVIITGFALNILLFRPALAQEEEIIGGLLGLLGGSILLSLLAMAAVIAVYIWMMVWVNNDAKARGQSGCMPMVLILLFGPIGLIVWLLMRPQD